MMAIFEVEGVRRGRSNCELGWKLLEEGGSQIYYHSSRKRRGMRKSVRQTFELVDLSAGVWRVEERERGMGMERMGGCSDGAFGDDKDLRWSVSRVN